MKNLNRLMLLAASFVVLAIILATVCAMYYRAHRAMVSARQYVSDASQLRIGVSGVHEFNRIRYKYSHYADVDANCNDGECTAKFKFDNGWPKNVYLLHSAFVYSVLTLSHGSITSSVIGSVCWGSNGGEFDAHSWESIPGPAFAVPFQEHHNMSSDKVGYISFNLTPAASAEQRARAYAFNVRYLGRFSACNDATDMH